MGRRNCVAAKVGVDGSCTGGWCQRCRIVPSYSGLFSTQGCCACWGHKTSPVHVFFGHNEIYYPHNNLKMTSTATSGSRKDLFAIEADCTLVVVKWILWCCVQFFMDECNHQLQDEIEAREKELSSMLLADRVAQIVRLRLQMQVPYLSKWAQALSVQVTIVTKVPLLHALKVT